jgi:hypothetical protein
VEWWTRETEWDNPEDQFDTLDVLPAFSWMRMLPFDSTTVKVGLNFIIFSVIRVLRLSSAY